MRAARGEEPEEAEDPEDDPPCATTVLTQVLMRINFDEVFFHVSVGIPSCPDAWDFSLTDYLIVGAMWKRFPPPHLVAGAFVSDRKDKDGNASAPRKRYSKKQGVEQRYLQTLDQLGQSGMMGKTVIRPPTRTKAEQERFDFTSALARHVSSGKDIDDFYEQMIGSK